MLNSFLFFWQQWLHGLQCAFRSASAHDAGHSGPEPLLREDALHVHVKRTHDFFCGPEMCFAPNGCMRIPSTSRSISCGMEMIEHSLRPRSDGAPLFC
mmetsp:Transcript_8570/g.30580  ORF Transcript_8570/g.30580 Transcript_8570/m.30580 type:complete len:98 (-) Transcript_8570:166-459(-)